MARPGIDFTRVKDEASFETVLDHYGITAIGSGPQRRVLCPFHDETEPSCSVHLQWKVFHCFGCGTAGSVLDFVAQMERCSLSQAAAAIAEWCDIERHRADSGRERLNRAGVADPGRSDAEQPVNRPLRFQLELDSRHPYLAERGLAPETVRAFGLGYCGQGVMRGRICIPIHDENGNLVAYAGRWPGGEPPAGEPRYRLPKGFRKSDVLFNLHRVAGSEHVVIAEGFWSVFRIHALGVPAIALMGCTLSDRQQQLLVRARARFLTVLLDGDEPGRTATAELLPRLAGAFFVRTPGLPDGEAPDTVSDDCLTKAVRFG